MNTLEMLASTNVKRVRKDVPVRTHLNHDQYDRTLLQIRNDFKAHFKDRFSTVNDGIVSNDEFLINNFDTLLVKHGSSMPMNIPISKHPIKALKSSHMKAINLFKKLYENFKRRRYSVMNLPINRKSASGWIAISDKVAKNLPIQFKEYLRKLDIAGFPWVVTDFHGVPLKILFLKYIQQFKEFIDYRIVITMGFRLDKPDKVKLIDGKLTSKTREFTVLDDNYNFRNIKIDPYDYKNKRIMMRRRTINKLSVVAHASTSELSQNVLEFFKEMLPWQHKNIPKIYQRNTVTQDFDVEAFDNSLDDELRPFFCETFGIPMDYMDNYLKNPYVAMSFTDNEATSENNEIRAKIITIGDLGGLSQSGVTLFTSASNYWKFGINIVATLYEMKYSENDIIDWLYIPFNRNIRFEKINIGDDNMAFGTDKGLIRYYSDMLKETSIYTLEIGGYSISGLACSVNRMVSQDISGILCNSLENPKRWNTMLKPFQGWGWKSKMNLHTNMAEMIKLLYNYFGDDFRNWVELATEPKDIKVSGLDYYSLNDLHWMDDVPAHLKDIVYYSEMTTDQVAQVGRNR